MANQPNRKSDHIRRVNRIIQTRTFILMLVMGVGVFLLLFAKLYQLQIVRHEELQKQAVNQQTRSTEITASRGTIYDRGGNILAISATAETIFLSPLELQEELEKGENTLRDEIAAGRQQLSSSREAYEEGLAQYKDYYAQYEDGRQVVMTDRELEEKIEELAPALKKG